ncbi:MAG: nitroreductase family protein [Candidatus Promineifilaceae bacterium]|jgi:coenzyme F420-0:L-glutamate ligase/coenzyme F420-1:gamma-L-glutamate ligase
MEEFYHLIRNRRAVRRYEDRAVPEDLLERLLETAVWAPSAHNRQPWRFAVLRSFESKDKLARAMGAKLRQDRLSDGDKLSLIERDVSRSYARITGAPVVILFFLSMSDMDHYPDRAPTGDRNEAERLMAVQSVAMAVQNLWLLASAEGLGACWLCAPLFVPELVQQTLDLPPDWEAQGLLTIGWPAEERQKDRRPRQESVLFL